MPYPQYYLSSPAELFFPCSYELNLFPRLEAESLKEVISLGLLKPGDRTVAPARLDYDWPVLSLEHKSLFFCFFHSGEALVLS